MTDNCRTSLAFWGFYWRGWPVQWKEEIPTKAFWTFQHNTS